MEGFIDRETTHRSIQKKSPASLLCKVHVRDETRDVVPRYCQKRTKDEQIAVGHNRVANQLFKCADSIDGACSLCLRGFADLDHECVDCDMIVQAFERVR